MEVNKDKCKVPHLGRMRPCRGAGWGLTGGSSFAEKPLGTLADRELSLSQQSALAAKRTSNILGWVTRNRARRWRELIIPSLLGTH